MPRKLPENIQWRTAPLTMHKRFPYVGFSKCGKWYIKRPAQPRGPWYAYRGEHPTSLDGMSLSAASLGALSDCLSRYRDKA